MRRTTTAAWAAVLCSILLSAGCDPVVQFKVLPHNFGLSVYVFDKATGDLVAETTHVVATSSEASYELDWRGEGSYFGVREPGIYTVYVEADGYLPAVFDDVEIAPFKVDAVEGLALVTLFVHLDPAN